MNSAPARYRIVGTLGKGGMGEVFLADDTQLERKVALKFLPEALERDPQARERFQREAKSAAALDHPFICKIYEVTEADGRPCIAMEYVVGETLEARVERGRLKLREVVAIGTEVAEALEEAHGHRIVHRDLKPANIMLTGGHVKVMDFGLAKRLGDGQAGSDASSGGLTQSGMWVGTPAYMSPEQVRGEKVDSQSDIFAFGTVIYELLVGEHPFRRDTPVQTMNAILEHEPSSADGRLSEMPDTVRLALRKMLAKAPADRYSSIADVRSDIGELSNITPLSGRQTRPSADATPVPTPIRRASFVGRESELAELRQALDPLVAGQGSVVLIGGEPGVGKTRLTEQFVAEARARGCLTFVGHCYETEGTPSYIPFIETLERSARLVPRAAFRESLGDAASELARLMPELRRIFDDIPAPIELPPDQQRRYLFNAYQEFMERATRVMPIVMVLEDLHWGDDPTLLLLQHLAQQVSMMSFLIIGTYRDVELDVTRPFARILEGLFRERLASRIPLRRLPESEVESLLTALAGQPAPTELARIVYRETEGNPFFVEEVFQHLSEEGRLFDREGHWRADLRIDDLQVPEGVRLVIGRRLERVGDETRRVLTVAAVIGRTFDLRVLEAAAADIDGDRLLDALEQAEKAQLISSATSGRVVRYIFAHELIRQTLADGLSLPRRQRLHARVAEAMERVYSSALEKQASQIAHHLYQSGLAADPDKTLRYLSLAADQAMAASGFEEALAHIDAALSMEEAPEEQGRADLLLKRGKVFRSMGRPSDARDAWDEALPIYEELGATEQVARLCLDTAHAWTLEGEYEKSVDVCRRGLAAVPDGASPERCRLEAAIGFCLGNIGEHDAAHARLERAMIMAESLDDRLLLGEVLRYDARFRFYHGEGAQLGEVSRRSADELHRAGAVWERADAFGVSQVAQFFLGRPKEVVRLDGELRSVADRIGHHGALFLADISRGFSDVMLDGRLDAYEKYARRGIEEWQRAGQLGPWFGHLSLGNALFLQGRWQEAIESLDAASRFSVRPFAGVAWGARFLVGAYDEDPRARVIWDEYRPHLPTRGSRAFFGAWMFVALAAEALAVLGERSEAYGLHPLIVEFSTLGVRAGFMQQLVHTSAGIAAACGEEWDTAQVHFEIALREADEMPHKIAQPDARRWYAWMLIDRDASGDRDKARTLLGEAVEMYQAIGMPKHLELAEGTLGKL